MIRLPRLKTNTGKPFHSLLVGLLMILTAISSSIAHAEPAAPDKLIESLFVEINQRVKQDEKKIKADRTYLITIGNEILLPYVSFETMSKQILGKNWRKITPDQRTRYTDAFKKRVSYSLVSQYDPAKEYDLNVTGSRFNSNKDRAAVSSVVTEKSGTGKYNISYKLFVDKKSGNWKVYDVVVEGVSVLQSFQTASAEDFKRNGIESMIAQLENTQTGQAAEPK